MGYMYVLYVRTLHGIVCITSQEYVQWNLSIENTIGTQLAVLYTVEPLYRGHH